MKTQRTARIFLAALVAFVGACGSTPLAEPEVIAVALKDVPAERLSYKYEPDVPAPEQKQSNGGTRFERNEAVQLDFDTNRIDDILDRTIASPSGTRILAVYRKGDDLISDFRLVMYSNEGKLLRKITHAEMALQFPDTIVWSPDGNNVAFVAKVRGSDQKSLADVTPERKPAATPEVVSRDGEGDEETSESPEAAEEKATATPEGLEASKDVLTFRTEQIYICDSEGAGVKPLTQVEGLMYFYFAWAPDSGSLAALAAIHTEWQFFETRAKEAGRVFIPRGRPRLIEKNGRERRLDDLATAVHPVWSPDSAKIAVAFDKEVRLYDGVRNQPSQAAIPLRNQLLVSSREYEKTLKEEGDTNSNTANSNAEEKPGKESANNSATPQPQSALPDASLLVSFNPIVNLVWTEDKMLYFETGFVRNYLDEADSVRSYMRWHRIILSAQPITLSTPQAGGQ
ncbi:MAG: hypothetical protein HKN33_09530 [Pyrinomonadaceae bacterium]|nr:hypothetical protein [Pyrinomonadaceae bacterium]